MGLIVTDLTEMQLRINLINAQVQLNQASFELTQYQANNQARELTEAKAKIQDTNTIGGL